MPPIVTRARIEHTIQYGGRQNPKYWKMSDQQHNKNRCIATTKQQMNHLPIDIVAKLPFIYAGGPLDPQGL